MGPLGVNLTQLGNFYCEDWKLVVNFGLLECYSEFYFVFELKSV